MALFLYTKGFVQLQHDEKVSNAMDQVTLQISDNAQQALNFAFNEAQQRLNTMGQFDPFTVTVVDEGVEVNDHPASSPEGVRESVMARIQDEMEKRIVRRLKGRAAAEFIMFTTKYGVLAQSAGAARLCEKLRKNL